MEASHDASPPTDPASRRRFLTTLAATCAGAAAAVVPLLGGLWVFLNPLRGKSSGRKVRITSLASLPADGQPHRFPVVAEREDAWSKYPPEPVGFVYLRRTSTDETPTAFSSVCPHLGCVVDFQPQRQRYQCPCHNSAFYIDGKRVAPESSPSPRDLDALAVTIEGGDVWITYQRFRTATGKQIEM